MLELTDNPDISANDYVMARNMAEVLHRNYPDHLWAVTCAQGLATVRNLRLSGKWGFTMKVAEMDNDMKCVMRAGGEILERYRLKRGGFSQDQYDNLSTTPSGLLVAEK